MKLKHLEIELTQVAAFEQPKWQLEQYPTSAHIAAQLVHAAAVQFGDIEDRTVIDLGVGCGVLSCGALLLGAAHVLGLDIDPDALEQAQQNSDELELELDLLHIDVSSLLTIPHRFQADTVIMNPPFGTKNKGIDLVFLQVASQMATTAIYSLHKTSTRAHVLAKAKEWGFDGQVVAQLRWDIPAMYKFHKLKSVDIDVDFIRFVKRDA